jgi:hypothetical protein
MSEYSNLRLIEGIEQRIRFLSRNFEIVAKLGRFYHHGIVEGIESIDLVVRSA